VSIKYRILRVEKSLLFLSPNKNTMDFNMPQTNGQRNNITSEGNHREFNRFQQLLTPWRLKWYPRSLLVAITVAFIFTVLSGSGASTVAGRLGGDYPAFYGAGRIIAEGDFGELYNWKRQLDAQKGLFPGEEESFLPFMYPPYVALAYLPLSLLPYRLSYVVYTLLLVIALLMTVHLVRPMIAQINRHYLCTFTLLLLFYPVLRSVLGGQNTALTLLFIACSWRAVEDGHEFRAGIFLGLLLFKPHFAFPLTGIFILSGRWRVGITSAITALFLYIIGIWMQGPRWVNIWFEFANWEINTPAGFEADKTISWVGFFEALSRADNTFASILGWAMVLGTIVAISWIWFVGSRRADLSAQIGLATPCLLLIPPHVYYYDAGLLFFTYAVLVSKQLKRRAELIGIVWLMGFSQILSHIIGVSPIFFLTVFTSVLSVKVLGRISIRSKTI
jgi:hypothetical protein